MYDTLTGTEIRRKIEEGDVRCILAHALYQDVVGRGNSLANRKDHTRFTYLEKADKVISHLKEHNLIIEFRRDDGGS